MIGNEKPTEREPHELEKDLSGLGFRCPSQLALWPDVGTLWDLGSVSFWASCHLKTFPSPNPGNKLGLYVSSKSAHPLAFLEVPGLELWADFFFFFFFPFSFCLGSNLGKMGGWGEGQGPSGFPSHPASS